MVKEEYVWFWILKAELGKTTGKASSAKTRFQINSSSFDQLSTI